MLQNLDCIALRTVKYSDRNSILTVFSRQEGRLSLLIPAGNGKQASRLRALLMPLGRFEGIVDMRPGREIYPIRDVRPVTLPPSGNPMRSTIALFVTDMLTGLLKEPMPDPILFDYLDHSIQVLNTLPAAKLANFHIAFLLQLSRFLGIEPDWGSHSEGAVFDISEGIFRSAPPSHRNFLPSAESETAHLLRRINFRTMSKLQLSRFDRNRILDIILNYYHIHYPSLPAPASLPILRLMAD